LVICDDYGGNYLLYFCPSNLLHFQGSCKAGWTLRAPRESSWELKDAQGQIFWVFKFFKGDHGESQKQTVSANNGAA